MPKAPIPAEFQGLPVVTAERMRALDEEATSKKGIPAAQLMEAAGLGVAHETLAWLKAQGATGSRIVVCCGRGNNSGDGLVAARYLKAAGAEVTVFICPPKKEVPGQAGRYPALVHMNLEKAKADGVSVRQIGEGCGLADALAGCTAAVDALLGTGSAGKPAGAIHHVISELTRSAKPVVAVDIPSGLHPDTGYHSGAVVKAALTLTLGLPKRGLLAAHAQRFVGELRVVDIGYPRELLHA